MNIKFLANVYNMSSFKAYIKLMPKHKFYFELEYYKRFKLLISISAMQENGLILSELIC